MKRVTKRPTCMCLPGITRENMIETVSELSDIKAVFMVTPMYGTLFCVKAYGHLPVDWGCDDDDDIDYGEGDAEFDNLKSQFNSIKEW